MSWATCTDDELMRMAYLVYEECVGLDNDVDLAGYAHQLQRRSDVPKEQAIRVLTRVRKEKMASGKCFPTYEERIDTIRRHFPMSPTRSN